MSALLERINSEINEKAMKYGIMGTEQVSITLELSAEEKQDFLQNCMGKLCSDKHYEYELHDFYMLDVTYTETIKIKRDTRQWVKVFPRNFNNEYFFVGFDKNSNVQKNNFMARVNSESNSSAYTCRKTKVKKIDEFKEITTCCGALKGMYTLYGSDLDVLNFLNVK